jgi:hypothetical protein
LSISWFVFPAKAGIHAELTLVSRIREKDRTERQNRKTEEKDRRERQKRKTEEKDRRERQKRKTEVKDRSESQKQNKYPVCLSREGGNPC